MSEVLYLSIIQDNFHLPSDLGIQKKDQTRLILANDQNVGLDLYRLHTRSQLSDPASISHISVPKLPNIPTLLTTNLGYKHKWSFKGYNDRPFIIESKKADETRRALVGTLFPGISRKNRRKLIDANKETETNAELLATNPITNTTVIPATKLHGNDLIDLTGESSTSTSPHIMVDTRPSTKTFEQRADELSQLEYGAEEFGSDDTGVSSDLKFNSWNNLAARKSIAQVPFYHV